MESAATSNSTLIPSARDLLLVFPRLAQKAGSLLQLPEGIMDNVWNGGSVIAEPTSEQAEALRATLTNASALARSTTAGLEAAMREGWAQGTPEESSSIFGLLLQFVGKLKNFGGIFSYLTSRWALATFAVAIALNRLQFYASPRERLRIRWYVRLAIYAVPIMAFSNQVVTLLEAMRCQTSPEFPLLRYGDPLKTLSMDFGGEAGLLYRLSSKLLYWKDDAACCAARGMSIPALEGNTLELRGSMSLLFTFFVTLCTSQLFETLFCALSGRHPVPETGMTIFEHSLAFAECEAMISSALGFGYFGSSRSDSSSTGSTTSTGPMLTRAAILQRLNVPPEVLLVCLISCFSHLSSAFLCIIDRRHKVRLINTGIWSCCYMAAFVWSIAKIMSEPIESVSDLGVLRFPTVCIVGFIPHLLIFIGIIACGLIYGVALLLTAFSIPDEASAGLSFTQRLQWAYRNLQANVQFSQNSAIRIHMSQDFYTVLLKVGFNVLTAASEAVYLNEGSKIHVAKTTWLEQKRIDELAAGIEKRRANLMPAELMGEEIATGVGFVDHQQSAIGVSPYARERRSRPRKGEDQESRAGQRESGLGIVQRRSRMHLTGDFVIGLFWLLVGLQARLALGLLHTIGIDWRPTWLLKAAGVGTTPRRQGPPVAAPGTDNLAFWMVGSDGTLFPAHDRAAVDVEAEMRRKRERMGLCVDETAVAEGVYSWWQRGGWLGDLDGSGDYAHPAAGNAGDDDNDDLTSVISMSTSASETSDSDGRRTPTQRDPLATRRSASPTPTPSLADDATLDPTLLARLLDPRSEADRAEARLLSHALASPRPLTRSRYASARTRQTASTAFLNPSTALPDSESELEAFILSRRSPTNPRTSGGASWSNGGEGMGDGGPLCVVCQSGPRTVLVWPCGCLSMCDECRVGLAMRNFNPPAWTFVTSPAASDSSQQPRHAPRTPSARQAPYKTDPAHTGSVAHLPPIFHDLFMQPESPSLSTPLPSTTSPTQPRDPLEQHGLLLHQHPAGDTLPPESEQRTGVGGALHRGEGEGRRVSPPGSARSESPNGGVSLVGTPSRAMSGHPKNRIEEYERAAVSPPVGNKRRGGPAFEVVKKAREPGDKSSPVSDLPNELITHTLSHLTAADLASVSLVSKRFHQLVTEPHAWRSAFARYFPGSDSIDVLEREDVPEDSAVIRSERRAFSRLTPLASWRSEYILRTRLLRSLARGKPSAPPGVSANANGARGGSTHAALPHWDYSSHLYTTVNRLHATFGTGLNKRLPRFIHGADDVGNATSSDPNVAKVDGWGLRDMQVFRQFWEHFPGDEMFGLGPGLVVGVPNVMDVSQPYGMIHGEGTPGRTVYFRSTEEQRGRFLLLSSTMSDPQAGIARISSVMEAHCSVWIAKSAAVPSLTDGLIGMLAGSSLGVLTAYSLGSANGTNSRDRRFDRGEMTARWVLSPGVPLIAIAVDNEYSPARQAQNRIWAVVLNALGEVFYLTKFPQRPHIEAKRLDDEGLERTAWLTGRSVYWNLVEPSRRAARPDVYGKNDVDGSYSPRSSWTGMCLSKEQVQAETREIETFASRKPIEFRNACVGWDMQRRLEVDFAGDDGNHAGEGIVVVECGLEEDSKVIIKRYVRCRFQEKSERGTTTPPSLTEASTQASSSPSLFGGATTTPPTTSSQPSFSFDSLRDTLSQDGMDGSATPRPMLEEWRPSTLTLNGLKGLQISASTLDQSTHATQTLSEDPLLSFSARSTASSPSLTPTSPSTTPATSPADVPGQRARLLALGTLTGSVLLWNIRTPTPTTSLPPLRVIHTASPQIASLALSSLYLVHGGNDGLVQAWDPLASAANPVRTLHSRHASRARRRIVQAQASALGVGVNNYAAGAIALDPDPTVLRGVVALGTHLRYWSYSSGGADAYKSSKRRLRRGERGSNAGNANVGFSGRGKIGDFIAHERSELEREKVERAKKQERLAGRFGTELLEGSEEELLAYAAMLSQESHEMEMVRRVSEPSGVPPAEVKSKMEGERKGSAADGAVFEDDDGDMDPDVARAIRLSLAETNGSSRPDTGSGIPIRQGRQKGGRKSSFAVGSLSSSPSPDVAVGGSNDAELSDLDFAIQLSLAEERSRVEGMEGGGGEFPVLENGFEGKGKGRAG